jgi:hypothetical protein
MNKEQWQKFQEFAHDHKDYLIMVASPREDAILVAFQDLQAFVKFPGKDMADGVVFNALRKSKFKEAIDPFMAGVIESTGITEKEEGGEVLKVLGGAMKNFGEARETLKTKVKKNAKN